MVGWVGDKPEQISAHIYCDADFAGCPYTLRSTSGVHCDLQGPNTRFPWAAGSNQQTSRAQSTPEAELASLNKGMKDRGETVFSLLEVILHQYHCDPKTCKFPHCKHGKHRATGEPWPGGEWLRINLHEDNTTCIQSARTGKNQTMKTLERGFGVIIGWINEMINSGRYNLRHTGTDDMSADLYTKCIHDQNVWRHLKRIINVYDPKEVENGDFDPPLKKDQTSNGDLSQH